MHENSGRHQGHPAAPSLDALEQYLPAVESLFQGLRHSVTSLSAVMLLVQLSPRGTAAGAEQGLDGTRAELEELYDRSRALDRRFQNLSIHRSLSSAARILLVAAEKMRAELFRADVFTATRDHSTVTTTALNTVQAAFEELNAFAAGTPWDTASINHSCAAN
jgi:hypothetical protein